MATKSTQPVPAGHTTVTPSLCFKDAAKAIEFYKKAFGAEEHERMAGPDGHIMHASIRIGSSVLMLADEMPYMSRSVETFKGSPVTFYLYFPDADAVHRRAIQAGAKEIMPVADQFWGDRMGSVEDPFGYRWSIATRTRELTRDEMRQAGEKWMKERAGK